jgi:hypothetical protein
MKGYGTRKGKEDDNESFTADNKKIKSRNFIYFRSNKNLHVFL